MRSARLYSGSRKPDRGARLAWLSREVPPGPDAAVRAIEEFADHVIYRMVPVCIATARWMDDERAARLEAQFEASDRRARILEGPIGPTLLRLSVPTVLASLVQVAISIVEGHALGRIGTDALAGAALVFPLFMLTTMLSAGAIGGAVSGAMARASGAGDERGGSRDSGGAGDHDRRRCRHGRRPLAGGARLLPVFGRLRRDTSAAVDYGSVFFPGMITLWAFNMTSGPPWSGDMVRPMIGIIVVTLCHAAICGFWSSKAGWPGPRAVVIAYGVGAIAMLGYMVSGRAGLPVRLSVVLPWAVISTCLRAGRWPERNRC